jgi:hypothetical protein
MRTFLGTVLFSLCLATGAAAEPNIVVILTDDEEDTGSTAYLPNVQALAAQGVTFKNRFVDFSLCAPSRSSFLTGQAAHNDGRQVEQAEQRRRLGHFQAKRSERPRGVAEGCRLPNGADRQL